MYLTCLILIFIFTLPAAAFAQEDDFTIISNTISINNENIKIDDPILLYNNRLFIPIAQITGLLNGTLSWNKDTQEITILTSSGDTVHFVINEPLVKLNDQAYFMDVASFLYKDRAYIPLRHAVEFLHAKVSWDASSKIAAITEVPTLTVKGETSLSGIGEQIGVSTALLIERNQLAKDAELETGATLKIVIPDLMSNKLPEPAVETINQEDLQLLAKIVQVEAGYESYEAQLAVANVILNRVKDSRFPDTIHGVVYQPKQFPPAHNGLLDKSKPNESVMKAAEAALNGENNVADALYFYNPNVTKGTYWDNLIFIKKVGTHRFVK